HRPHALAAPHVVRSTVARTDQDIALQPPLSRQVDAVPGAVRRERVIRLPDIDQDQRLAVRLDLAHLARPQLGRAQHRHVLLHRASSIDPQRGDAQDTYRPLISVFVREQMWSGQGTSGQSKCTSNNVLRQRRCGMARDNFNLKDYVDVAERIRAFYERYPEGSIQTEMVRLEGDMVIFKATVYRDREDVHPTTGWAYE